MGRQHSKRLGDETRPGMVRVLVSLHAPPRDIATPVDRGAEYSYLLEQTSQARRRLIAWLKSSKVWEEVEEVGEPNAFSMIPITCSSYAANLLKDAPEVEAVAPSDTEIGLIE